VVLSGLAPAPLADKGSFAGEGEILLLGLI
jgi:hypothetical protein